MKTLAEFVQEKKMDWKEDWLAFKDNWQWADRTDKTKIVAKAADTVLMLGGLATVVGISAYKGFVGQPYLTDPMDTANKVQLAIAGATAGRILIEGCFETRKSFADMSAACAVGTVPLYALYAGIGYGAGMLARKITG